MLLEVERRQDRHMPLLVQFTQPQAALEAHRRGQGQGNGRIQGFEIMKIFKIISIG